MKNNLPNKLTVLRIILTFVVIGLLVFPYAEVGIAVTTYDIGGVSLKLNYAIAGLIYILASLTDFVDGYLARRWNMVTDLGKMLDAIADKILVNSVLIILAVNGMLSVIHSVNVLIPVIIVLRDIVVNAIKMQAAASGKVVAAIGSGKLKTASLMIGTTLALYSNLPFELIGKGLKVSDFLLCFAAVMSLISGIQYWYMNKHIIFGTKK